MRKVSILTYSVGVIKKIYYIKLFFKRGNRILVWMSIIYVFIFDN